MFRWLNCSPDSLGKPNNTRGCAASRTIPEGATSGNGTTPEGRTEQHQRVQPNNTIGGDFLGRGFRQKTPDFRGVWGDFLAAPRPPAPAHPSASPPQRQPGAHHRLAPASAPRRHQRPPRAALTGARLAPAPAPASRRHQRPPRASLAPASRQPRASLAPASRQPRATWQTQKTPRGANRRGF
jgi:hypothetical protein